MILSDQTAVHWEQASSIFYKEQKWFGKELDVQEKKNLNVTFLKR